MLVNVRVSRASDFNERSERQDTESSTGIAGRP
jgi:hypothetical protein